MSIVEDRIQGWRTELLDMSSRNALLSMSRSMTRPTTIHLVAPDPGEFFRRLTQSERLQSIVGTEPDPLERDAGFGDEAGATSANGPVEDALAADPPVVARDGAVGVADGHSGTATTKRPSQEGSVHTDLPPARLAMVARRLRKRARESDQEQGINTLFAAFGTLKWWDDSGQRAIWRYAPLVLLPLRIEEDVREDRFRIAAVDGDPEFNQTLVERLRPDPDLAAAAALVAGLIEEPAPRRTPNGPEPDHTATPLVDLLGAVRAAIARLPGWEVLDEVHIGHFQFHKLRMFQDLGDHRAIASRHPLIQALATPGATVAPLPQGIPDADQLDRAVSPQDTFTVLDADASQLWAIQAAKRGANLIVQGPPGTGKSQTIANVIAECLAAGKTVLFVSEKAAAIEVVHRRLAAEGLADFCLMLHSQKAGKKDVIDHLAARLEPVGSIASGRDERDHQELGQLRERLNAHAAALHRRRDPYGASVYEVYGRLALLPEIPYLDVTLPDIPALTEAHVDDWERLVGEAAALAGIVRAGPAHPWHGFSRNDVGLNDREALADLLGRALATVATVRNHGAVLAAALGLPAPVTVPEVARLSDIAGQVPLDAAFRPEWFDADRVRVALELGTEARHHATAAHNLRAGLPADYTEAILPLGTSANIAAYDAGLFARWFGGDYRRVRGLVRAAAQNGEQRPLAEEQATLRRAVELDEHARWLQEHRTAIADALELDEADDDADLLDPDLLGQRLDTVAAVSAILGHLPPGLVPSALVPALTQPGVGLSVAAARERAAAVLGRLWAELDELGGWFTPDVLTSQGMSLESGALDGIGAWLTRRRDHLADLDPWLRAQAALGRVRETGLEELIHALSFKEIPSHQWAAATVRTALRSWLDAVPRQDPALHGFDRTDHDAAVRRFRELDLGLVESGARRVRQRLAGASRQFATVSGGEPGVLLHEARKRRRHMPLRRVFERVPNLLLTLTPCLMMSPLSVAQFLPADRYRFDIVIFDEASQVRPYDAIGAIMRGRQLVVAGDRRQLPPTSFFDRADSVPADDEDGGVQDIRELESILDALDARGMASAPLRWHYRSRHEDLIAFSNHHIYDRRLITFPAITAEPTPGRGVRLEYVPDAVYAPERDGELGGTTRVNRIESRRAVALILEHARTRPDKSLGVVALGLRHRDTIDRELLEARKAHPELEGFFAEDRPDPFFVKALEQVQGDERDVILISIGFGKNADGKLSHNFGPINNDGGERRLNVLVTRARYEVIVVSSIRAHDIDLARSQATGVRLLKNYLDFAERGPVALAAEARVSDADYESPFEASVGEAIKRAGHTVRLQVGVSSYRIDLAVVHPRQPGRFLLGIECDGATYHSSPTARDRDRLRQEILEGLGWQIHRVWSTDWIRDPASELKRITDRIAALLAAPIPAPPALRRPEPVAGAFETELATKPGLSGTLPANGAGRGTGTLEAVQSGAATIGTAPLFPPYQMARLSRNGSGDVTSAPVSQVAEVVVDCVTVEGPIHRDVLISRVRAAWGHAKGGSRITKHVTLAIEQVVGNGLIQQRGEFLWPSTDVGFVARGVDEQGKSREVGQIAIEELTLGMTRVLEQALSLTRDALIQETAKAFGYHRTGSDIRVRLGEVIDAAVYANTIEAAGDTFRLPKR